MRGLAEVAVADDSETGAELDRGRGARPAGER